MSDDKQPGESGQRRGFWAWLWARPKRWFLLGIPAGGFLAFLVGIGFSGGFMTVVEASSTLSFCTSCHEMQAFVYQEYKQTPHYQNASGVRAICSDCHVPHALVPKLWRKFQATYGEIPAHFMGKIDTREKFEAHRAELAQKVWDRMEATDSATCRKCHSYEAMAADKQDRYAQRKHSEEYRKATGATCIDCHKGIAHHLPEKM